jgi:23S rRNA (guanine2445-N2)-methyltransferase / 23S rRNA (guanine2069-N7)-methyltransferase
MMNEELLDFFITTAKGMEPLLVGELTALGAKDIIELKAGVACRGTLSFGYKACLYGRTASRVLLILKTLKVHDAKDLYDAAQSISWTDHLDVDRTLAVDFLAPKAYERRNQAIIHTHFGAQKIKDAIVDQFRSLKGARPSVDLEQPDLRINVFLRDQEAIFSIDLSGSSLHRRGYRAQGALAPLKENLAAAILLLCQWPREQACNLIDPTCGSGTLLIEAALMAKKVAPGLLRKTFGFEGWLQHNPKLWQALKEEAEAQIVRGRKKLPRIYGYDKDAQTVRIALANIERAQVSELVSAEVRDLSECSAIGESGIFLSNPPYGERLGELKQLQALYKQLGDIMKNHFKGWEGYIFTGNQDLAKFIGLKASRRYVLFNGTIECRLLKYDLY